MFHSIYYEYAILHLREWPATEIFPVSKVTAQEKIGNRVPNVGVYLDKG